MSVAERIDRHVGEKVVRAASDYGWPCRYPLLNCWERAWLNWRIWLYRRRLGVR